MKKISIAILFLHLLIVSTFATQQERDSLRTFLECIGEDSMTTAVIMDMMGADPLGTIDMYLLFYDKVEYIPNRQQYDWVNRGSDSVFVRRCVEYVSQKIIRDTALNLLGKYLLTELIHLHPQCSAKPILECADYAITNFHARQAISIPQLYYFNHKELEDWQEELQHIEMIDFILCPKKYFYEFGTENNKRLSMISAESNDNCPFYAQYRRLLNTYSDIALARITPEQKQELFNILQQGIEHGDKKAELTYAFMLLTGQFVVKNEKLGQQILSRLLD